MATEAAPDPVGILDLEVEILAEVFQFIVLESPWTIPAVRRVNKRFHDVVALVQDRRIDLAWSDNPGQLVRRKHYRFNSNKNNDSSVSSPTHNLTWKNQDVLQHVRILTVAPLDSPTPQPHPNMVTELVDVLKSATNVKTLNWLPSMEPSEEIINALSLHHPTAQLRVSRMPYCYHANPSGHNGHLSKSEASLASSTNLSTLTLRGQTGRYFHPHGCPGPHLNYPKLIASAPSLKSLSVIDCRIERHTTIADAGMFNNITQRSKTLRHLTLELWPLSAETLDFWNRIVDLKYLETLKHTRGEVLASYFPRAAELLTGLQHFSLNMRTVADIGSAEAEAARQFVESCSPLKTLSLWSWMGIVSLDAIMKRHGSTLTALHLHEREEIWPVRSRKVMSLEDIRSIRTACPNLKSFTFDLRRQSNQPKIEDHRDILEEVRDMNLQHLEIYLDSGLLYVSVPFERAIDGEVSQDEDEDEDDDDGDGNEDADKPAIQSVEQTSSDNPDSEKQTTLFNHCGGAYIQTKLCARRIPEDIATEAPEGMELLEEETLMHPPSSADGICEFAGDVWKFVFGARSSGPRILDMKFGEWERVSMPRLYQNGFREVHKDIRTWVRARPHERDDMKGQCFAQMKCCQGKHWKCWATT